MTKLWHAFLELPTWQGVALIAGAGALLVAVALISQWAGSRRYKEGLRQIAATDVPPIDASGRALQDTVYHMKDIAETTLDES